MASKLQNKNAKKMLARHTCPEIGLNIIQKEERKEKKKPRSSKSGGQMEKEKMETVENVADNSRPTPGN